MGHKDGLLEIIVVVVQVRHLVLIAVKTLQIHRQRLKPKILFMSHISKRNGFHKALICSDMIILYCFILRGCFLLNLFHVLICGK